MSSGNSSPISEIEEVLRLRRPDLSPRKQRKLAKRNYAFLKESGLVRECGGLEYNGWYIMHHYRGLLFDENYEPMERGVRIDPHAERMSELRSLGGHEAVAVYNDIMGESK